MSLVADVIASVRHKGVERGGKGSAAQLEELLKRGEDARGAVVHTLESRYQELCALKTDTQHLHHRVNHALTDLTDLRTSMEQEVMSGLEDSVGEVGGVVRRWREVACGLEAAGSLLTVHTLLADAHEAQLNHDFVLAARNLAQVEGHLEEAKEKEVEGQMVLVEALREEVAVRRTQLLWTIGEVWGDTIRWEEQRGSQGARVVTLVVGGARGEHDKGHDHLAVMVGALYMLGELQRRLATFAKNLMNHVFKPLIHGGSIKVCERSDGFSITVSSDNPDTTATAVLTSLQMAFKTLHSSFLQVELSGDGEDTTLMALLGQEIGGELTETLIKECLAEAVPYSRAQLQEYEDVKTETQNLQDYLVKIGFYSADEQSIMSYAANVDVVFANKACGHWLHRARDLMTRPVHDTLHLAPLEPDGPLVIKDDSGNKIEASSIRLEKLLAAKTFNLPKCQISASVVELVELVYEVLEEACTSSPQYAGRLFYTARNILTLYCHVTPTHHAAQLATIPQLAAILHNNAMYLGHHALLMGHQYRGRLPQALRDNTITMVDLAQDVRKMATTTFLKALQGHRAALIDTLRESAGLDMVGVDAGLVGRGEQGVRQVVHQLQLLHRVWQHVLPHTVYTKAMGTLVGSVVEEVVVRVVAMEDISADSALALITLLTLLKDNIPPLFQVEGEERTSAGDVVRRVRGWGRFVELVVVLGASLRDILDRWSDGKGPLAHEFTPDEAKQLVRALFQNTSRRAQVLATIK